MRKLSLLTFLFVLLLLLILLTPVRAWACPPAASHTYAAQQSCYVAPAQTYYQQTVLAYPLTMLAVPAVTVQAQPVVPAQAPVPQQAPPPPQVEQQSAVQVQTPVAVVQRQVYATYAAPLAAVVSQAYSYGYAQQAVVGYGHAQRAVVGHGRSVVVNQRAVVRQRRVGPVRGLFQRIAAGRAARSGGGVPVRSQTTVIVR